MQNMPNYEKNSTAQVLHEFKRPENESHNIVPRSSIPTDNIKPYIPSFIPAIAAALIFGILIYLMN